MTRVSNERGLALIKSFEGLSLTPYLCPAGKATIGYGSTRGVTMNSPPITRAEADRLLRRDLGHAESVVDGLVDVPLNGNQFSALASFVFNVGAEAFRRSTMLRKLNAGDYLGAAAQFERWIFAGGKELPGLKRRRAAERSLFLSKEGLA